MMIVDNEHLHYFILFQEYLDKNVEVIRESENSEGLAQKVRTL